MIRIIASFISLLLVLQLAAATAHAEETSFKGRLVVPQGVNPSAIEVIVHESAISEIENDPQGVQLPATFTPNGEFSLSATTDTTTLILEFTGPGVRRARFPWPATSESQAVFRLEPGYTIELLFKDAKTGEPIPGAIVGPISPAEDAGPEQMEKSYPFFVRADEEGRAAVTGLAAPRAIMPVQAEGYQRQVEHRVAGHTHNVELEPGGGALEGRLVGDRTMRLFPHTVVRLRGVETDIHVMRKTDAEGTFRFDGLPPGPFGLAPVVKSFGDVRENQFIAVDGHTVRGITLEVPEGIRIGGQVVEAEYERPLSGVTVLLQGQRTNTDELGYFDFDAVDGPWPAQFSAEHPEFIFSLDEQSLDYFPINGHRGEDIDDIVVRLRRERMLEIIAEQQPEEPAPWVPAALEVWGPIDAQPLNVQRERLSSEYQVLPLASAGTRLAIARTATGLVSDLHTVKTADDATTTTIQMTLAPGATLKGSLSYTDETPVEHYRVLLAAPSPIEIAWMTVRPDETGLFEMSGLPPGEVEVRFMRSDDAPFLHETIKLVRGETVELHRSVGRGQPLAGTVVNEEGEPLGGITIHAYGFDPQGLSLNLRTVSDDSGMFRFEGFAAPTVREMRVDHFQHAPYTHLDIPVPDEEFLLVLEPRAGINVEVNTPAASLLTARVYLLQGALRIDPMTPGQWYYTVDSQHSLAGEPSITLSPLTTGELQVAVEADGEWDVSAPFTWAGTGSEKNIVLTPGHHSSLVARVDGIGEEELPQLEVSLLNTSLPETSDHSYFTPRVVPPNQLVFDDLPAGNYLLIASSALGEYVSLPNILLLSGQRETVDLSFDKALVDIAATLKTDDGKPVSGARVIIHYGDIPEPDILGEERTGSDGTFAFELLAAGRPYLLQIEHGANMRQVNVPTLTESRHLDIVLASETAVRFLIPDSIIQNIPARGHIPIYFSPTDGSGMSVARRASELQEPVPMLPGAYRVAWGEQVLGNIEVRKTAEPMEIVLPDPAAAP